MTACLRTIAIDLTPLLPGGENGGAKVFVVELIRSLAVMAPHIQFVLLTRRASHEELSLLDASNVSRKCVLDREEEPAVDGVLRRGARRLLWLLPRRLGSVLAGIAFSLKRRVRAGGSGGLLHTLGADLLFCPFTAPTYAEAGVPVVCTLYDLQYRTYPEFFAPEDVAHRAAVFRAACRDVTRIAAISDYARDSALCAESSLEAARVRTIHLRIARRLPTAADPDLVLARLGVRPGRYFLYPANFWKHKNHEMLLAAFGIAARAGLPDDFALVCTGAPGERRDYLRDAVAGLGLAQRVILPGYLDDTDLGALLRRAAGVIFPSLYEGFGLPVVEAMAVDVPVACSNVTSLPEVAAGAALLFDPRIVTEVASALVNLATDPQLRGQLVEAGRERAKEFADTSRMAAEYLALFEDSLGPAERGNSLSGVYEDGWVGSEMQLYLEADAELAMEFLAPDWLPHSGVRIQQVGLPAWRRRPLKVRRAHTVCWNVSLKAGRTRLRISPSFVPARQGLGSDSRELTLMLLRCKLTTAGGSPAALWELDKA